MNILIGQRAAVYGLLLVGLSTTKIGAILGLGTEIVRRAVSDDWMPKARGRKSKEPKPKLSRARVDAAAVIAMHAGGEKTLQEVGVHFGITRERVRQLLERRGIDVRRGPAALPREVHEDRLRRYYTALRPGMTTLEAAAAAGLARTEIQSSAKCLGVKLPKPTRRQRIRYRELATYYENNPHLTGRAVARHFDVSPQTLSRSLRVIGVKPRHKGWKIASGNATPTPQPSQAA